MSTPVLLQICFITLKFLLFLGKTEKSKYKYMNNKVKKPKMEIKRK